MVEIIRDIDHPDRDGVAVFCDRCRVRMVRVYTNRPEFYAGVLRDRGYDPCRSCAEKEAEGAKADSR